MNEKRMASHEEIPARQGHCIPTQQADSSMRRLSRGGCRIRMSKRPGNEKLIFFFITSS